MIGNRRTVVIAAVILVLAATSAAAEDQVFFVVRHAERADGGQAAGGSMSGADPELSAAGRTRAKRLADMLRDAAVTEIFTTEYRRTRQTAQPLADTLRLEPVVAAAKDPAALLDRLRVSTGRALVVGHSNTIPGILKGLGVSTPVTIADEAYDDLFIVTRTAGGRSTLIHLKY